ncbi:MAG: B12-binding domain-containing radical SAM protein [Anaerolineae bacterium]
MTSKGRILLINPWIYDFAAYNLWIEPLGLLTIAAALRQAGYSPMVVDCLAPHPTTPRPRHQGAGKFLKTRLTKPEAVAFVPRHYGRYGLPMEDFELALARCQAPDLVLVASGMTYWYPGVVEAIRRVRVRFGSVPVALGGVYATLCPEHARQQTGADWVIEGPGLAAALTLAGQVTGGDADPGYADAACWPAPAHDLLPRSYAGVITAWGCPYRCTYCASHRLQPTFIQRRPRDVVEEIAACARQGVRDFAFYDDALLLNGEQHLVPILEGVLRQGLAVRYHTPNGMHARAITPELANLMYRAGFSTVYLSLETVDADRQQATGGKVTVESFAQAIGHLQAAGFGPRELGAYILVGLPGQPLDEVEKSVQFVHGLGVQAKLALFSPIPGTPDGDRAIAPDADPLLHNNTVYPYLLGEGYVRSLQRIKQIAKEGNAVLSG